MAVFLFSILLSLFSAACLQAASGRWSERSPDTADHGDDEENQWPR